VNNLDANPSQLPLALFMSRLSEKLPADKATQMRDVLNEKFASTLETSFDIDDKPALVMLAEHVQRLADYGIAVENDAVSILDTETVRLPEGAELSAMVVCFNRAANSAAKTEFVTLSRLNERGCYDELCQADKSFTISLDFKAALIEKYQESGAALAKKLMVNAPRIGLIR
jgi:sugar/nucleoside kinase (ribokinase family)